MSAPSWYDRGTAHSQISRRNEGEVCPCPRHPDVYLVVGIDTYRAREHTPHSTTLRKSERRGFYVGSEIIAREIKIESVHLETLFAPRIPCIYYRI